MTSVRLKPRRVVLPAITLVLVGCTATDEGREGSGTDGTAAALVDRAAELGVDFVHNNGMNGELYMVEMVGAGAALFDYDNDNDLDLYLVDGGQLGPNPPWRDRPPNRGRLYRNLMESGSIRFEDVTAEALPPLSDYGQGVIAGDVDNDGWVDLYLTNYGANTLLRNVGDGTFALVPGAGGADDERWNTAAVFVDFDRDGFLDLFVAAYIDATIDNHYRCTAYSGIEDYCGPRAFPHLTDRLYRNRGEGTFEDVSITSGIAELPGSGLGAVAADFNGDGLADIYVANDQMENFLWLNQGDGTFANQARISGVSVNDEGLAEASMGVEAADLDGDGALDLFLTHLKNETHTLYSATGRGVFTDRTGSSGIGPMSLPDTSFGTRAFDLENDGDLDLIVANGAVNLKEDQLQEGDPLALKEPNRLFINRGDGSFDAGNHLASALDRQRVSRGIATGDVDNDGDSDLVVTNNHGPVELLINALGQGSPWVGLDLRLADAANRPALGALVRLQLADGRVLVRQVQTAGSFLSSQDHRVIVGLGGAGEVDGIEVNWPDGTVSQCRAPDLNQYTVMTPESENCR